MSTATLEPGHLTRRGFTVTGLAIEELQTRQIGSNKQCYVRVSDPNAAIICIFNQGSSQPNYLPPLSRGSFFTSKEHAKLLSTTWGVLLGA